MTNTFKFIKNNSVIIYHKDQMSQLDICVLRQEAKDAYQVLSGVIAEESDIRRRLTTQQDRVIHELKKSIKGGQTSILFRRPEWIPVIWYREDTTSKLQAMGLVVSEEDYPCDHFYLNGGCDSCTHPECFSTPLPICGIRVSLPKERQIEADREDLYGRLNLALSTASSLGYHQALAANGLRIIERNATIMSDPNRVCVRAPLMPNDLDPADAWEKDSIIVRMNDQDVQ